MIPTHRLAAILAGHDVGLQSARFTVEECEQMGASRLAHNDPARAGYEERARVVMRTIGLVAVPGELVEAVREARGCFTNCAGPMRGYLGDANVMCDQCAAKMRLAEAVLEQMEKR